MCLHSVVTTQLCNLLQLGHPSGCLTLSPPSPGYFPVLLFHIWNPCLYLPMPQILDLPPNLNEKEGHPAHQIYIYANPPNTIPINSISPLVCLNLFAPSINSSFLTNSAPLPSFPKLHSHIVIRRITVYQPAPRGKPLSHRENMHISHRQHWRLMLKMGHLNSFFS